MSKIVALSFCLELHLFSYTFVALEKTYRIASE